jgi:POT family proton-dependent oligopeptide transporter
VTVVFLGCLSQGGMSLTLFIERLIHRDIFGYEISSSFFYGLEPLFLIFISPLFLKLKFNDLPMHKFFKMTVGFLFLALAFKVLEFASTEVYETGKAVSLFYIVVTYLLFAISELIVIPSCMAAFDVSLDAKKKGFLFSLFSLAQGISEYLTGYLSQNGKIDFELYSVDDVRKAAEIYTHLFSFTWEIILVFCIFISLFYIIIVYYYCIIINEFSYDMILFIIQVYGFINVRKRHGKVVRMEQMNIVCSVILELLAIEFQL